MLTLRLKKIDPVKWATISGLLYAVLSLIVIVPMFLFMSVIGASSGFGEAGMGILGGGVMMLFMPIIYGIVGFIFGLIAALIFNFVLKKTNGLDMEFEKIGLSIDQIGTDRDN